MERKREPPHEQEAITWKVSEGNECGGSPEQKEQRKPTRNRNHSMKSEEERKGPSEESGGRGRRAGERRAESDRRAEEQRNRSGIQLEGEKRREKTKTKPQIARTHVKTNGKLRNT